MGFVATALGVNIVVWVPGLDGDIIVHRQHQVSIGRSPFLFRALRHVSTHIHRKCPRISCITDLFNSHTPLLPALIDQGAIASIFSADGAVSAIHLYFYNYSRPDDTNVTEWASSLCGHFELLLPPGEGWPEGDVRTPRKGNGNIKRCAKGSPLQPSPPKRETPEEMLLKEEQQKRAARNKKRAEVGFGTYDVSLELHLRVTHVVTRTAAQIPHKYLRAKRVPTHCDPTLTVAQIPHKCLRAKRANTYCDSTLTAAQIPVKCF